MCSSEVNKYYDLPLFPDKYEAIKDVSNLTPTDKALLLQKEEYQMSLCFSQNICPICGSELDIIAWDNDDDFHPEDYSFKVCTKCNMRTNTEVDILY